MRRTTFNVGLPDYTFMRMGTGYYTGENCKVIVKAARPDAGITLKRADVPGGPAVPAAVRYVQSFTPALTVGSGRAEVMNPSILLAALYAAGSWDTEVVSFGPEIPILDGDMEGWLQALEENQLMVVGGGSRRAYRLAEKVEMEGTGWSCVLEPAAAASIDVTLNHKNPGIKSQRISLPLTQAAIRKELGQARIFGFRDEVDKLEEGPLARGAKFGRAVLFEADGTVATRAGLRYPDEAVRYKAAQLIGDFTLLGRPLLAKITAKDTTAGAHRDILWRLQEAGLLQPVDVAV